MDERSEFLSGVRAQLPILVGVIPFGFIYGTLGTQLQLPALTTQAMSLIMFGGSAQFIALPLIADAAPGIIILLTVSVVNLRHMLYSASVAPYLQHLPRRWKLLLAYLLTDEAYAVAIAHYQTPEGARPKPWFFLGTSLILWVCWQLSTAVGVYIGGQVPASWSLDFALPLTFTALVIPMLKDRAYVVAALVAGGVGVLTIGLPYKLGLTLAALLGIAAGMAIKSNRQILVED
ncbi:MAG: AzlC family ABC transporter permease [Chloroflexi bacterium]|nr:AzlC family ABC transporter permease [Chloroflexota bacterium]